MVVLLCSVAAASQTQSVNAAPGAPAGVVHPAYPHGGVTPLAAQINTLLSDPAVARAHWGIAVTALDGTPLYGLEEDKFFRPASNAKLYTTAAAMALLGPDATVTTTVTLSNGTLVLHGVGDSNLSGRRFPYESAAARRARLAAESSGGAPPTEPDPLAAIDDLAAQVAAKGVKSIRGGVVGDDTLWPYEPYAIGWGIDDIPWGYGAPVTALAANDNQMQLTITPAGTAGQPASLNLSPRPDWLDNSSASIKLRSGIRTVGPNDSASIDVNLPMFLRRVLAVSGTVPVGKPDTEEIADWAPAESAANFLAQRLKAHGVSVAGYQEQERTSTPAEEFGAAVHRPIPDLSRREQPDSSTLACGQGCTVVASHTSPSLSDDVVLTLKISQNLHAEMLLKRMGKAYGDDGTFAQGARVVRQWLLNAGLDGDDFVFYDGSGLSSHDLVTPRTTAQLLAYASTQPWFPQWKAALPVGGEDGSLTTRFPDPPLKDHVFAKTGTLGESRALSGYLDCASGRQVIFSIFVDDHSPGGPADRITMDRIVAAIAAAE